jgi:sulfide:quinone oxidoreductase
MDIRAINSRFSVTGQIDSGDMQTVAAAGFKTLICNRPDNEGWGQPKHIEIKEAAEKAGLSFHYVPAVSGALTGADVTAMRQALSKASEPVLAFCRSGARSANLYQLATADADN